MGRTLLIATWGQPALWGPAVYVLEERERRTLEHCTSLPLLLEKYGDADVALLVLDSLVDEYADGRREGACYECYDKQRGLVQEAARAASYSELRKGVEKFVEELLGCLGIEGRARVVVCPAVGSPGGRWSFESKPGDFEAVALAGLGPRCLEEGYERVVLDLTHGVNFMPAVALRVAERLANILLLAHGAKSVKLEVYNSDPYPPRSQRPELRLNLVAREEVRAVRVPAPLPERLLRPTRQLDSQTSEGVRRVNEEYKRTVEVPLSALYYPLPLALHYSLSQAGEAPLRVLEDALGLWERTVSVYGQRVKGALRLEPDAVYALLLVEAVLRRLGRPEYPARLERLRETVKLYESISEPYYYLIVDELSKVERSLARRRPQRGVRLCELYGEECRYETPDKRVMIAHAGLQKELVLVDPQGTLSYQVDVVQLLQEGGLLIPFAE